jgi:hypothetical protein
VIFGVDFSPCEAFSFLCRRTHTCGFSFCFFPCVRPGPYSFFTKQGLGFSAPETAPPPSSGWFFCVASSPSLLGSSDPARLLAPPARVRFSLQSRWGRPLDFLPSALSRVLRFFRARACAAAGPISALWSCVRATTGLSSLARARVLRRPCAVLFPRARRQQPPSFVRWFFHPLWFFAGPVFVLKLRQAALGFGSRSAASRRDPIFLSSRVARSSSFSTAFPFHFPLTRGKHHSTGSDQPSLVAVIIGHEFCPCLSTWLRSSFGRGVQFFCSTCLDY